MGLNSRGKPLSRFLSDAGHGPGRVTRLGPRALRGRHLPPGPGREPPPGRALPLSGAAAAAATSRSGRGQRPPGPPEAGSASPARGGPGAAARGARAGPPHARGGARPGAARGSALRTRTAPTPPARGCDGVTKPALAPPPGVSRVTDT